MSIVEKYLKELKRAYYKNGGKEMWDNFEKIKEGASEEDIKKLKEEYPEVTDSLIELLKNVDGTYFRKYKGETIAFYFLGSDIDEYPYYLLSSSQILETKDKAYNGPEESFKGKEIIYKGKLDAKNSLTIPKPATEKYEDNPSALREAGLAYAIEQVVDLVASDINGIHLYTMNRPETAKKIIDATGIIRK